MGYIQRILLKCKNAKGNMLLILFKFLINKIFYKNNIFAHQKVIIRGKRNIDVGGELDIGTSFVGFQTNSDVTLLNVRGKLFVEGKFSIGRGCRFDIGEGGIVELGDGGYIAAFSLFIITKKLKIGKNCAISWNCQFLDNDFHHIEYEGKKEKSNSIIIGDNVWIGSGVSIYKGTIVPNGCVIASNSVVRGVFENENSIISGNPAKVIKEKVTWFK